MKDTDKNPKSIWKKSWKGPRGLLLWFVLLTVAAFIVVFCFGMGSAITSPMSQLVAFALIYAVGIAVVGTLIIAFIRWLCCWRNFRRFLLGLASLAVLIALFYLEENWRGKHDWEKFRHEWEAKSERFDFASFVPPSVPDDQNFALTPIVASSWEAELDKNGHRVVPYDTNVVNRLEMTVSHNFDSPTNGSGYWLVGTMTDLKVWQQYYHALAAKTNEFPVAPQLQSPATDVLLALSKYDPAIEELRQASRLPYSRFPLNYEADCPATILLPHLAGLKRPSQVLQLRAIAELQSGQNEKALDDIKLMLHLVGSVRAEPFLISHLVRIALLNITLQPIWEGLAEHKWSDKQLIELDQELAKLDLLADYCVAMRGEQACSVGVIDYLRRTRKASDIFGAYGDDFNARITGLVFYLSPSGWFYQNQFRYCRYFTQ